MFLTFTTVGFTTFKTVETEWTLKKQSEGITVYNRDVENSSVKEIKAVTQIKTSLASIIALLYDRANFSNWVYKCEKAVTLKEISNVEAIYYQNVIAPWPIDNRDIVIKARVEQNPITKVIHQYAHSVPNYVPAVESHVRITKFNATWVLTPLKNGNVICEYTLLFDPGGNLPSWLVNLASTEGPFETTFNMKKVIFNEKYQKSNFDFINELN